MPHIVYRYVVNGETITSGFKFPSGTNPMLEFAQAYVEKIPLEPKVTIFYNQQQPEKTTLEPGVQGDWMVLALGVLMVVVGSVALIF